METTPKSYGQEEIKAENRLGFGIMLMLNVLAALVTTAGLTGLLTILLYVVVICLVAWLFYWLVNYIAPPEPIKKIAVVIVVVVFVIALLYVLLGALPLR